MQAVGAPRQVRVEHVMGTTVSIDVREPFVAEAALDEAIAWFHDVDRRFSPYREDSEVTRVGTGELAFEEASLDVRAVFTLADVLRDATDGYFDAAAHRPDGRRDPTGVTKGWAVDEALYMLRLAGARNVQVTAGATWSRPGSPSRGGRGGSGSGTPASRTASPPCWASPAWRSPRPGCMKGAGTSAIRIPASFPRRCAA
jgi:thiamine biosynthesis lipoprotein